MEDHAHFSELGPTEFKSAPPPLVTRLPQCACDYESQAHWADVVESSDQSMHAYIKRAYVLIQQNPADARVTRDSAVT